MEKVWKGRGWRAEDGVRRKEEGGGGSQAQLILLANVLSNAPAARDRMVRGAAG